MSKSILHLITILFSHTVYLGKMFQFYKLSCIMTLFGLFHAFSNYKTKILMDNICFHT